MKNRMLWRQRSGDKMTSAAGSGNGARQDSQESTISTSSSIREFELFQQFCSNTVPDWETPTELSELTGCSWGGASVASHRATTDDLSTSCSVAAATLRSQSSTSPSFRRSATADQHLFDKNASSTSACYRRRQWSRHHQHQHRQQRSDENLMTSSAKQDDREFTSANVNLHQSLPETSLPPMSAGYIAESDLQQADNRTERVAAATTELPSTKLNCLVRLLDGTELKVDVLRKSEGRVLFDAVCSRVNLIERDYFGLSYSNRDGIKVWLRSNKRIARQVCDADSCVFSFEVKFYPPDISAIQEEITRYQLCLQVQRDIASGKILCSFMTYALLGSYLVQSLLADSPRLSSNAATDSVGGQSAIANYLDGFTRFAPPTDDDVEQNSELLDRIAELHAVHRGMSAVDAEIEYLQNASKLAMYGVDLHPVQDYNGEPVTVGVSSSGLLVYKELLRIKRFSWVRILKVTYRNCNFYVNLRPHKTGQTTTESAVEVAKFRMASHQLAKRLWRSVVEHHTFFRMDTPSNDNGFLSRLFRLQFHFSGRTQQQVQRDAATVSRRPLTTSLSRVGAFSGESRKLTSAAIENAGEPDRTDDSKHHLDGSIDINGRQMGETVNEVTSAKLQSHCSPARQVSCMTNGSTPHHQYNQYRSSPVASSLSVGACSLNERKHPSTPSRCSSDATSTTVRTQSRTVVITSASSNGRSGGGGGGGVSDVINHDQQPQQQQQRPAAPCSADDFGTFISAQSHSSRTHTIETTTYQMERDGVIETLVEKRLLVNTEGSKDPREVLHAAMQSVAAISSEMCVEKVEIHTMNELELD